MLLVFFGHLRHRTQIKIVSNMSPNGFSFLLQWAEELEPVKPKKLAEFSARCCGYEGGI